MTEVETAPEDQDALVSVVLIFLDEERFLAEAIDSVVAQTYERWELLLVDDGSEDRSADIARGYVERDPARIRYLEHPGHANRGVSASRNRGIAAARGEYVAFLDGDDVWLPDKLREQLELFAQHPDAGMVCGASEFWYSWTDGPAARSDRIVRVGAPQDALVRPPQLLLDLYPLGKGATPCTCSFVVRRDVLTRVGGFEDHFRAMYEDQAFVAKVYLEVPVYVSSRCWDRYRQHPSSIMATTDRSRYHATREYFLHWLRWRLRLSDVDDPRIEAALRRATAAYRHPRVRAVRQALGRARSWVALRRRWGWRLVSVLRRWWG